MKKTDKEALKGIINSESFSVIATDYKKKDTVISAGNINSREIFSSVCEALARLAVEFTSEQQRKLFTTSAKYFEMKAEKVSEEEECPGCPACEGSGGEKLAIMIAKGIGEALDVLGNGDSTIQQGGKMTDITLDLKRKIEKMYAKDSKDNETIDLRKKDA